MLKAILTLAQSSEIYSITVFFLPKTKLQDIGADLKASNLLPGASSANDEGCISMAETILRCATELEYVQIRLQLYLKFFASATSFFGICKVDKILLVCSEKR